MDIDEDDDFYAPEEPKVEKEEEQKKPITTDELEEGEEEDEGAAMDEDDDDDSVGGRKMLKENAANDIALRTSTSSQSAKMAQRLPLHRTSTSIADTPRHSAAHALDKVLTVAQTSEIQ
jgi:hypothetical protein